MIMSDLTLPAATRQAYRECFGDSMPPDLDGDPAPVAAVDGKRMHLLWVVSCWASWPGNHEARRLYADLVGMRSAVSWERFFAFVGRFTSQGELRARHRLFTVLNADPPGFAATIRGFLSGDLQGQHEALEILEHATVAQLRSLKPGDLLPLLESPYPEIRLAAMPLVSKAALARQPQALADTGGG